MITDRRELEAMDRRIIRWLLALDVVLVVALAVVWRQAMIEVGL